eukprot:366307-Chlamydomonas_euryale.AAC.2
MLPHENLREACPSFVFARCTRQNRRGTNGPQLHAHLNSRQPAAPHRCSRLRLTTRRDDTVESRDKTQPHQWTSQPLSQVVFHRNVMYTDWVDSQVTDVESADRRPWRKASPKLAERGSNGTWAPASVWNVHRGAAAASCDPEGAKSNHTNACSRAAHARIINPPQQPRSAHRRARTPG